MGAFGGLRKKLRGREPVDWAIEQGHRGAQTGESGQRAWACSQGGRPWGVHSHPGGTCGCSLGSSAGPQHSLWGRACRGHKLRQQAGPVAMLALRCLLLKYAEEGQVSRQTSSHVPHKASRGSLTLRLIVLKRIKT